MITVFYDGKCGLCLKEINYYRLIAPPDIFNWQDITESTEDLKEAGITLSQGLKFLHAKDSDGNLHIGVDAFILIWRNLNRWRLLAAFVSLPVVRPVTEWAYSRFANWRFKRLVHCQLAAREEK